MSRSQPPWRLEEASRGYHARMGETEMDLRAAVNAISDVIQNRPRPLREFDQIYMKAGDMVHQSELVGRWADGRKLAFIGDGDAISICVSYLQRRHIVPYGGTPSWAMQS